MANTVNYNFLLPTPGASVDTWGAELTFLHAQWDAKVFANEQAIAAIPTYDLTQYAALAGATFTGTVTAPSFVGSLTGNADTASAWETARTLTLSGVISGSIAIDGSSDGTLTTSIADGALSIAKTAGLQTALDAKESSLAATQKRIITYGTAAVGGTLAEGSIYLQHEA